jgi:hypothetical protein
MHRSNEEVFAEFLEGWRDGDWSKVRSAMQLTGNYYGYNEQKLREMLGSVRPVEWEIVSVTPVSVVMVDISARVMFGRIYKRMTARLVRESAPFVSSEDGSWGVAPLSVLTLRDDDV